MNLGAFLAGGLPSVTAQAEPIGDEYKKKVKKEGLAGMLSGIGKGNDKEAPALNAPTAQGLDIQSFLASLFGG